MSSKEIASLTEKAHGITMPQQCNGARYDISPASAGTDYSGM
jgi:hypothetical protein